MAPKAFPVITVDDEPPGRVTVKAVADDDYGLAVQLTTAVGGVSVAAFLPVWVAHELAAAIVEAADAVASGRAPGDQ